MVARWIPFVELVLSISVSFFHVVKIMVMMWIELNLLYFVFSLVPKLLSGRRSSLLVFFFVYLISNYRSVFKFWFSIYWLMTFFLRSFFFPHDFYLSICFFLNCFFQINLYQSGETCKPIRSSLQLGHAHMEFQPPGSIEKSFGILDITLHA